MLTDTRSVTFVGMCLELFSLLLSIISEAISVNILFLYSFSDHIIISTHKSMSRHVYTKI